MGWFKFSGKKSKSGSTKVQRNGNTGDSTSNVYTKTSKGRHEHKAYTSGPNTPNGRMYFGGDNDPNRSYNSSSSGSETGYQPGDEISSSGE